MIVINKIRARQNKMKLDRLNDSFIDHTVKANKRIADNSSKKSGRFDETFEDVMFMHCVQGSMLSSHEDATAEDIVAWAGVVTEKAIKFHSGQ